MGLTAADHLLSREVVGFQEDNGLEFDLETGMHQRNLGHYDYGGHFNPLVPWLAHLFGELSLPSLSPLGCQS